MLPPIRPNPIIANCMGTAPWMVRPEARVGLSRTHLDLLGRKRPSFQRRIEIPLQRLELRAELPGLRHLKLLLSATQLLARVPLGLWRDALMLVDLPQCLFLGGADRRGVCALRADFLPR